MAEREQGLRACLVKLGWDESGTWEARDPDDVALTGTNSGIRVFEGAMHD